jgi:hypothetical protein
VKKKFVALLALIAGITALKKTRARRAEEDLWNSAAKTPEEQ